MIWGFFCVHVFKVQANLSVQGSRGRREQLHVLRILSTGAFPHVRHMHWAAQTLQRVQWTRGSQLQLP